MKKWMLVLVAALVLGGIIWIFRGAYGPFRFLAPSYSSMAEAHPHPGWKTYTNSRFGYSFEYPPEFSLKDDPLYPMLLPPHASGTIPDFYLEFAALENQKQDRPMDLPLESTADFPDIRLRVFSGSRYRGADSVIKDRMFILDSADGKWRMLSAYAISSWSQKGSASGTPVVEQNLYSEVFDEVVRTFRFGPAPSCEGKFVWPKGGEVIRGGTDQKVAWIMPNGTNSYLFGFYLVDEKNNDVGRAVHWNWAKYGQNSWEWDFKTLYSSEHPYDELPAAVNPGRYKLRFEFEYSEESACASGGFESGYFEIR